MSKYDLLWEYIKKEEKDTLKLSFEEIKNITGAPIDHSFLRYKKELEAYGYKVSKISMKEETVTFEKNSKIKV